MTQITLKHIIQECIKKRQFKGSERGAIGGTERWLQHDYRLCEGVVYNASHKGAHLTAH